MSAAFSAPWAGAVPGPVLDQILFGLGSILAKMDRVMGLVVIEGTVRSGTPRPKSHQAFRCQASRWRIPESSWHPTQFGDRPNVAPASIGCSCSASTTNTTLAPRSAGCETMRSSWRLHPRAGGSRDAPHGLVAEIEALVLTLVVQLAGRTVGRRHCTTPVAAADDGEEVNRHRY